MKRSVLPQYRLLDREKKAFLATLEPWPPGELCICPAPHAWSAVDVLDHVAKTERAAFVRMRENFNQPIRISLPDRLCGAFIIRIMRTPLRVRVPDKVAAAILPDGTADFTTVRCTWNDSQAELKEWLSRLETDPRSLAGFQHPVSGWMSISQSLNFLASHVRHHRYQLVRIMRQLEQKRKAI
jgi:hypothetical protein